MSDPSYAPPPADHRVKITHLVFGLLFLGAAGTWALGASGAISGEHLAVLAPALLIGAGVVGLAASLASGRNRRRTETLPATYPNPAQDTEPETVLETGTEPTEEIR
jgi:hypothetical protein